MQRENFSGREGEEICQWKVCELWWVQPPGGGMCSEEEGSDVSGGWSGGYGSKNHQGSHGILKRIGQPKQDGTLVDRKSVVLNALKCVGISRLSVSKIEVSSDQWRGNIELLPAH
jgi:hypothetical protein